MKNICIIHPEGNINNNPNLLGIVEILSREGFHIDLFSGFNTHLQQKIDINNVTSYIEDYSNIDEQIRLFFKKIEKKYFCVIGVDTGIIPAAKLSEYHKSALGYISYEIFFKSEIGENAKKDEIIACRNVNFAIVQDPVRGKLLSEENKIPIEKMIFIPVSGSKKYDREKNYYLHDELRIDRNKKIAISIGSIDNWTIPKKLLDNLNQWSEDWVLVLHSRYGLGVVENDFFEYSKVNKNLFLSDLKTDRISDLTKILNSADVGIALYYPTFSGAWTGKNIKYIGFSSGKISTYLANGLPFITNLDYPYSMLFESVKPVCAIADDVLQIPEILKNINIHSEDCYNFFDNFLNLEKTIKPVITKLQEFANTDIDSEPNHNFEKISEFMIAFIGFKTKLETANEQKDMIKKSFTFKVGFILVQLIHICTFGLLKKSSVQI